jgi:hypothetical protein
MVVWHEERGIRFRAVRYDGLGGLWLAMTDCGMNIHGTMSHDSESCIEKARQAIRVMRRAQGKTSG